MFVTANKGLENFLWVHGFVPKEMRRRPDFLNEWVFESSPELLETVDEYQVVLKRKRAKSARKC